jgi:ketosteroid isomerase-like protein
MESDPAAVVDRYWQRVWADGDLAALDELLADRYVRHSGAGNVNRTPEQVRKDMTQYFRVLRTPQVSIEDRAVAGDTVWTRLTLRGLNIETGERTVYSWLHVARVVDGRIAEAWHLSAPNVDWTKSPAPSD